MAGFRNKTIKVIYKVASWIPSELLRKLSNQPIMLPFYHTVSDEDMPHIKHLYPLKRIKAFEQDLDFFLKHYQPIDLFQFLEIQRTKQRPSKPCFLLSFDDGLREFHDIIAPILVKKGIPAICFLNSAFVDNKDLFYRYKASLLVEELIKYPELRSNTAVANWIQAKFGAQQAISTPLLAVNYANRSYLDELAQLINVDFKDFLAKHSPYLTRPQINSLIDKGFHFGGHSVDHPEYQYIDYEQQIRQTKESMETVCADFSLNYKTFSFPFTDYGVSKQFFTQVHKDKIATSTFGGAGLKQETIPTHFQRIPFEMGHLTAKQIHNAEFLYYLLKIPFGKNRINRQ